MLYSFLKLGVAVLEQNHVYFQSILRTMMENQEGFSDVKKFAM